MAGLLALLSKGEKGKGAAKVAPEADDMPDMGSESEELAMQDLGAALDSGDYKAAASAFKRAMAACKGSDDGDY